MKNPLREYKTAVNDAFEQYLDGNITKEEMTTQIKRAFTKMQIELKKREDNHGAKF